MRIGELENDFKIISKFNLNVQEKKFGLKDRNFNLSIAAGLLVVGNN